MTLPPSAEAPPRAETQATGEASGGGWGPRLVGMGALVALVGLLLVLVGRPLATDDLWFHLKMGEVYLGDGLWPEADPMLHTAGDRSPVQHEWLFQVASFLLHGLVGFQGLRVFHCLAVSGIVVLAFAVLRRESGSTLAAAAGTCAFLALAWWRLIQFRPDLVSIPAAIGFTVLIFAPRQGPSWTRIVAAVLLLLLWANAHSLFGIGLALGLAGLLGILAQQRLETRLPPGPRGPLPAASRVAAAIFLGAAVTLLNPRGLGQHLTFFTSSSGSAIWKVLDEWSTFTPFALPDEVSPGLPGSAWFTMNALLVLFAGYSLAGIFAFLRRPRAAVLKLVDPVLGALALASVLASLVSIRFLWMGFFVVLFLMRGVRGAARLRPSLVRPLDWSLAGAALGLTLGFAATEDWRNLLWELRQEPDGYLATPYLSRRYCGPGIRFLADTELEGRLFNPYHMGGYAGYWLSPRIRTFIDGRTEHYPPEVMDDYLAVLRGARRGEPELFRVLRERRVDLFLGMSLVRYGDLNTVNLLARRPGWLQIYRSANHAIYLRNNPRNRENLRRVERYYRERGIPFDPEGGVSILGAIRADPRWAIAQGMIPEEFVRWQAELEGGDPDERFLALTRMASVYRRLGEYATQEELDRRALELQPDAVSPRRRLVLSYRAQGRLAEAAALARELHRQHPEDAGLEQLYRSTLGHAERTP